jgi:predicted nucleic acid-binding protein
MVHAVLVDTCTLVNFAAAGRLDLLQLALDGRGRWTDAATYETRRATDDWPALRSLHVTGWLGEPISPCREGDTEAIFQLRRQLGGTRRAPSKHLAEAEAIHLILHYPEFAGAVLLTDDLAAGDLATKRGIEVWLSMTVLSQAYFDGHIDCPAAYAVLLDMRHVDRGVYVPGDHQSVCPS